jgi:hypothetical protein
MSTLHAGSKCLSADCPLELHSPWPPVCRYSPEAHLVVEKAGYAPRLLGFDRLPGCWLLVVIEYLDSAAHWNDAMTKPADSLRAAVKVMHDADNVHGDLRSPNVLVKDDKVWALSSAFFIQSQPSGSIFCSFRETDPQREAWKRFAT